MRFAQFAATFRRTGVCCVRKLVSHAELETLRAASEAIQSTLSPLIGTSGSRLVDTFCWLRDKRFLDTLITSKIPAFAAAILEVNEVRLFYDQILDKPPGASRATPWHQDLPYWPLQGSQVCTVWLALDDVDESNGGMEYLAGSHCLGIEFQPVSYHDQGSWKNTSFPTLPPLEELTERFPLVSWPIASGDAIAHHGLTIHGARNNTSSWRRRRSYITRWIGPSIRYQERPETLDFPTKLPLKTGDPCNLKLFPRFLSSRLESE